MRKFFCKLSGVISVFLCLVLLVNTIAFAADSQPNAAIESISIYKRSGILKGETIQLEAEIVDETSSVPDEILSTDLSQAEITE